MKKGAWFGFILAMLTAVFLPAAAWAQGGAGGEDIFGSLAGKAQTIGEGLTGVGYVIAGLGLVVFSFMAIFNKIKWSTLAYIMVSCFVLSAMVFVITMFQEKGSSNWIGGAGSFDFSQSDYDVTSGSNADSVPVSH